MAGEDPTGAFSATDFRAGIELAMGMGLPTATANQPTFRWTLPGNYVASGPTTPAGTPWNLTAASAAPAPLSISDLAVNCAVDYMGSTEEGTVAGVENAAQVRLTLLDTDYKLLIAHGGGVLPDRVLLGGDVYIFDRHTQVGLFSVDVYFFYATAEDQR
jgi:hypothetical protein